MTYDYLIVGCGIVGLTIAIEVKRTLGGSVCVLEKESAVGAHASGRNSGVLHAGIYYKPDTLKGRLSVEGNKSMRAYCDERGIKQVQGKVIVTKNEREIETLKELAGRALANGAEVTIIDGQELKEIEPFATTVGLALYSPNTVTIDPKEVLESLLQDAKALGIDVVFNTKFAGLKDKNRAITSKGTVNFGFLINAAGAYADTVAHMYGIGTQYTMIPYKGIYFRLRDGREEMIRGNIYPVPDIRFPFLGVHLTRTPKGIVKIGPTAIPALSKENYAFLEHIKKDELAEVIRCNAQKLLIDKNYALLGFREVAKYIPYIFYREAKKLLPALEYSHITSYPNAGIRAQLFDISKKELESDFVTVNHDNSLHVLNAVSPAFTSSLAFAKYVVGLVN